MVHQAILSGAYNDLASGNNVDLCVITKDKVQMHRNYDALNTRHHKKIFNFPKGTAPVWKDLTAVVAVEDRDVEMTN